MPIIPYSDFDKVELRVGTIIAAEPFPEARKPAIKMTIDFGSEIGIKRSSAQITQHYTPERLVGTQVLAVTNFEVKQIGKFLSECLVTGVEDEQGYIVLVRPDIKAPNGSRLC